MAFDEGWYLIYTMSQQENKVARELSQKKIHYFLPKIKTTRQWNDRKKIVEVPLFPSYIFVKLDSSKTYFESQNINGVCFFVKIEKKIIKVSQTIIDQLDLIIMAGTNIRVLDKHFPVGKTFCISEGTLRGLYCEIVKYEGKEKILVRVYLLNRDILIDLPVDILSH